MKFWILGFIFQAFARLLRASYRFKYIDLSHLEAASKLSPGGGTIIVTWHGNSFAGTLAHGYQNVAPLTSLSPDGMHVANLCRKIGLTPVSGSSSKGGEEARNNLLERLKSGDHIAITVDGPKGPIYDAKPGCVDLARKSGAQIVPLRAYSRNFWQLKSWDRLKIPKPFSEVFVVYGRPIIASNNIDGDEFEKVRLTVNSSLNQLESRP